MERQDLGYWLVRFEISKDLDAADILCETGNVRIDGMTVSNMLVVPKKGSIITTLTNGYSYKIPTEGEEN